MQPKFVSFEVIKEYTNESEFRGTTYSVVTVVAIKLSNLLSPHMEPLLFQSESVKALRQGRVVIWRSAYWKISGAFVATGSIEKQLRTADAVLTAKLFNAKDNWVRANRRYNPYTHAANVFKLILTKHRDL